MRKQVLVTVGLSVSLLCFIGANSVISSSITNVVSSNDTTEIAIGKGSHAVAGGISISGNKVITGNTIKDIGIEKVEKRKLDKYNTVEINGFPGEVFLRSGKDNVAIVRADGAIISAISTKVNNGKLLIDLSRNISTSKPLVIDLSLEGVSLLTVNGVADVVVEGINTDRFRFELNGSGSISATGVVRELDAVITGSGDLQLSNLVATICTVNVNGAGDAVVHANDVLTVQVNGSGDVVYHGQPGEISKTVNGAGDIVPAND